MGREPEFMKEYRNLIDLYYHNVRSLDSEKPFIYNSGYALSYRETERITNALARVFLKHTHEKESVTVIVSQDSILKAVCAISLIKVNVMFVFLQPEDINKFNAIQDRFYVSAIVCDNVAELPRGFLSARTFLWQLRREDLKEYGFKADGRPLSVLNSEVNVVRPCTYTRRDALFVRRCRGCCKARAIFIKRSLVSSNENGCYLKSFRGISELCHGITLSA